MTINTILIATLINCNINFKIPLAHYIQSLIPQSYFHLKIANDAFINYCCLKYGNLALFRTNSGIYSLFFNLNTKKTKKNIDLLSTKGSLGKKTQTNLTSLLKNTRF